MPAEVGEQDQKDLDNGLRRSAAFLLALDAKVAARVMRCFSEHEVSVVSEEMTRMGSVSSEVIQEVLGEFNQGEVESFQVEPLLEELLREAVGADKARGLLERIRRRGRTREPFRALRRLTARQLEAVLKGEHPQVLAIVLSNLESSVANDLVRGFDEDLRYDVIRRIAITDDMPYEMVLQVDQMLEARAVEATTLGGGGEERNRFQTIAQVLNISDPTVSKHIMEKLAKDLPKEAQEIQQLMFVFEDLVNIGDKDMQRALGELDKADLVLSLKTASTELKEKIVGNLSKRARETLEEEMEMLGPKPLSEVEEAQKRIIDAIRSMEERGEIQLGHGGGEELV